ncbi:T9SS C-terminal target domain-containing protein [Sphingobacteriales bacterium UPWRP_1]|nr:hypothetical protein BVG80_07605 [Sphingobacteriales bacterium TSM_CSM]PSJ76112.1 T9SS C-terminal target domain-containing protein [Sphingobacteriales bacterium UPWRP_1]
MENFRNFQKFLLFLFFGAVNLNICGAATTMQGTGLMNQPFVAASPVDIQAWCDVASVINCGGVYSASTADGANNIPAYPGCVDAGVQHLGKEEVFIIEISEPTYLSLGMEILTTDADLDLFLLSYNTNCTVNCLASSGSDNSVTPLEGLSYFAMPGLYFIVVDANTLSTFSSFILDVTCGALNCTPVPISCGQTINSSTTGMTNNVSFYGCSNSNNVNNYGPEIVYSFTTTATGNINIALTNLTANLELFLLNNCNVNSCVAQSFNAGTGNENISLTNQPADTYYIVVDGYGGQSGNFTLSLNCGSCSNNVTMPSQTICSGSNLVLTASTPGNSYLWSTGSTMVATSVSPVANTTYTVTVSNSSGSCIAVESFPVTVIPPTSANAGFDVNICQGQTASLSATGGISYIWSTGQTNSVISVSPATTTNYAVTVTDVNACTGTDAVTVNVLSVPPADISPIPNTTTLTCAAGTLQLVASGGVAYNWGNGITSQIRTINAPGTYTVTVTGSNGCTASSGISITSNSTTPVISIVNNTGSSVLTCNTPQISLTANGGLFYNWGSGNTSNNTTITAPGIYTVAVTDANGCTASASVTISANFSLPSAVITNTPNSTELSCTTDSIQLSVAAGGLFYVWNDGITTPTRWVTGAGTYTVTVTGANGCTNSSGIVITGNTNSVLAAISSTNGTTLTCTTTAINLTASGGVAYLWNNGSNVPTRTVSAPGTYTVTVAGSNGCTASAAVVITSNTTPPPIEIIKAPDTNILNCTTTAINLTASGGVAYLWNNGSNVPTRTVSAPGTYTVTVTGSNGCTASSAVVITSNTTLPVIEIIKTPNTNTLNCATTSISLIATGGVSYQWSGGLGNSDTIVVTTPGTYTVTGTGSNGCIASDTVVISTDTTPPVAGITSNTGTSTLTCATTSISLTATGGVSYQWENGWNMANRTVNSPGTYSVIVTGSNGCTASTGIFIGINIIAPTAGIITTPNTNTLTCAITSISLTATGGVSYQWSGGLGNSANAAVSVAGTYTVTVTGSNGCTASDNIVISIDTIPPVAGIVNNTGTNMLTCYVTAINVTATGGNSYTWSDGAVAATRDITIGNTAYTVTVTGPNGCTDTESVTIISNTNPPNANASINQNICFGQNAALSATGGALYHWSTGQNTAAINVTPQSTTAYAVTVTGSNGCTGSYEGIVEVNPPTYMVNGPYTADPLIICLNDTSYILSFTITGNATEYLPYSINGTPFYSNNNTYVTDTLYGLNYSLNISDATGCTFVLEGDASICNPDCSVQYNIAPYADISGNCVNGLSVSVLQGPPQPPVYMYSINGQSFQESPVFSNLSQGTYPVYIQTGCGTQYLTDFDMPGNALNLQASINQLPNGQYEATALATGGVPPYFYTWSNGQTGTTIYLPDFSEVIEAMVTDNQGCQQIFTLSPYALGIDNETVNNSISIYPNPSYNNHVTVKLPVSLNSNLLTVHIFDMAGKMVAGYTPNISGNFFLLDTKQLSSGIYYLHIYAGNYHAVSRLILTR